MSDYAPKTWSEGETGHASDMNHLELGVDAAQEEAEGAARVNVRKYGVTTSASGAQNVKGINEAIAALPSTGGTLFFPERGQYNCGTLNKSEPINAEGKSGVVLEGQGGVSAGNGLGYPPGGPAVNFPPTFLAYAGRGTAFINAKKTTGFGLVNIEVYAYDKRFAEDNGYVVDLSESQVPFMTDATVECTGEAGIIQAKCMLLVKSNIGVFTRTWFKGGKDGVVGRVVGGGSDYSYNHTFIGCGFVAQSNKSVLNLHNGWGFYGCAFEPHYNEKGEKTGAGGGWLGYSGVAFESIGTVISNCFFGALPGEETGTAVEWFGNGLTIIGGELACAENAIVIPVKSSNITIHAHINLCVNGLVITSTNANEVDRLDYRPSFGKRNSGGAILPYFFSTGKPKGARLQIAAGNEFKAIAAPGAFKKGTQGFETEAEAKAIREKLAEILEVLKSRGLIE